MGLARIRHEFEGTLSEIYSPGAIVCRLCDKGRFGVSSGMGYYRYDPMGQKPHLDPRLEDILNQVSRARGITRRIIKTNEILERCVAALVDEGQILLRDGIAMRASDIDLVCVSTLGFPSYKGGPMYYSKKWSN